jgi:hypothetical protein
MPLLHPVDWRMVGDQPALLHTGSKVRAWDFRTLANVTETAADGYDRRSDHVE